MNKKDIESIVRDAFAAGEIWGITYSGWFSPADEDTEKRVRDVLARVFKCYEVTDE